MMLSSSSFWIKSRFIIFTAYVAFGLFNAALSFSHGNPTQASRSKYYSFCGRGRKRIEEKNGDVAEFTIIEEGDGELPSQIYKGGKYLSELVKNQYRPKGPAVYSIKKNSAFKRGSSNVRSTDRAFPKSNPRKNIQREKNTFKGSTTWLDIEHKSEEASKRISNNPSWQKKLRNVTDTPSVSNKPSMGVNIKPSLKRVQKELKSYNVKELESLLKEKYSSSDDSDDFYDEDDEGYEKKEEASKISPLMSNARSSTKYNSRSNENLLEEQETIRQNFRMRIKKSSQSEEQNYIRPDVDSLKAQITKKSNKVKKINDENFEHLTLESIGHIDPHVAKSFRGVGLTNEIILQNLQNVGIKQPTHVQASSIESILKSEYDVIIHSHTGSGKTLAFLLPIFQMIDTSLDYPQAVVIAPGRELGSQIYRVAEDIVEGTDIRIQMVIGGANVSRQLTRLKKKKPHILIGTPGRICELALKMRRIRLSSVSFLVLDEIDSLMRTPYQDEIDSIIKAIGNTDNLLTIFSSATGRSSTVKKAAKKYLKEKFSYVTGGTDAEIQGLPSNIAHTVLTTPKVKKFDALRRLMHTQPYPQCVMIFVNDIQQVRWLTEKLDSIGIISAPLSGDTSKEDRTEIMRRLADERLSMIVTTEMAARGIDVPQITHVINYDLPTDADHYVHRAGRCGRAGRPGIVVNFATPDTKFVLGKFRNDTRLIFSDIDVRDGKLLISSNKLC